MLDVRAREWLFGTIVEGVDLSALRCTSWRGPKLSFLDFGGLGNTMTLDLALDPGPPLI